VSETLQVKGEAHVEFVNLMGRSLKRPDLTLESIEERGDLHWGKIATGRADGNKSQVVVGAINGMKVNSSWMGPNETDDNPI
jgi:hypothetical protein